MKNQPGRTQRLYVTKTLGDNFVRLDEKHAHYIRHVLRMKAGERLVLFDGRGEERIAGIVRLTKAAVELDIIERAAAIPESHLDLNLIQALAKADAMDLIVQKATELGARAILPVVTEYSVVKLAEHRLQRRMAHWQRIAQSACEQSGRHRPPEIHEPKALADVLDRLPENRLGVAVHPGAESRLGRIDAGRCVDRRVYALVGPEGGLSVRDLRAAALAGFDTYSLGPRILRTETAALSVCTLAQALWGDMDGYRERAEPAAAPIA
jgi:16S rRNA (uracil1498-N3)-methyltransferase